MMGVVKRCDNCGEDIRTGFEGIMTGIVEGLERHVCAKCIKAELASVKAERDTLKNAGEWTDMPPTEPGYYFIKRKGKRPEIARVMGNAHSHQSVEIFGDCSNAYWINRQGAEGATPHNIKLWHTRPLTAPEESEG